MYQVLLYFQVFQREDKGIKTVRGIEFDVFYHEINEMFRMGKTHSRIIFDIFKESSKNVLDWTQFVKMMNTSKTRNTIEKLKLFHLLADQDGNGNLSYDEIYQLSKISLQNSFRFKSRDFSQDHFLTDLCEFFSKLIFEICEVPLDEEI